MPAPISVPTDYVEAFSTVQAMFRMGGIDVYEHLVARPFISVTTDWDLLPLEKKTAGSDSGAKDDYHSRHGATGTILYFDDRLDGAFRFQNLHAILSSRYDYRDFEASGILRGSGFPVPTGDFETL